MNLSEVLVVCFASSCACWPRLNSHKAEVLSSSPPPWLPHDGNRYHKLTKPENGRPIKPKAQAIGIKTGAKEAYRKDATNYWLSTDSTTNNTAAANSVSEDQTVFHFNDAVGERRQFLIVGNDNEGLLKTLAQIEKELMQFFLVF